LRKNFRRKTARRKSFLGHARRLNDLPIEAATSRPTQDSLPIGASCVVSGDLDRASKPLMQLESTLTCPACQYQAIETMPTDACQ
jgi:hypothetical protein